MVTQRSGPQGKPGEKWLRDLTPDNATAPAPDPTRYIGAHDCGQAGGMRSRSPRDSRTSPGTSIENSPSQRAGSRITESLAQPGSQLRNWFL